MEFRLGSCPAYPVVCFEHLPQKGKKQLQWLTTSFLDVFVCGFALFFFEVVYVCFWVIIQPVWVFFVAVVCVFFFFCQLEFCLWRLFEVKRLAWIEKKQSQACSSLIPCSNTVLQHRLHFEFCSIRGNPQNRLFVFGQSMVDVFVFFSKVKPVVLLFWVPQVVKKRYLYPQSLFQKMATPK